MPVSKRTRYEVLRRDNHTCRYCRSTENPLTIDHVLPVSLGGSDAPENLVTACQNCNAGKSSSAPDAETVAEVSEDARRWAAAIKQAAALDLEQSKHSEMATEWFRDLWLSETGASLPRTWHESITTFLTHGLEREHLVVAVSICSTKTTQIEPESLFRYFCGICWSKVREIRALAEDLLAGGGVDG